MVLWLWWLANRKSAASVWCCFHQLTQPVHLLRDGKTQQLPNSLAMRTVGGAAPTVRPGEAQAKGHD